MDNKGKPSRLSAGGTVLPLITREDLEKTWIGLGAAIEWIAMRGQRVSRRFYHAREDDAAEALVKKLADMLPEIAEALVRGAAEGEAGPLVPIPAGIWRQTATSDAKDEDQPYRLIGTDDQCEWDGAILGTRVSGYRRIQIRTDFIRDNWPEGKKSIKPLPSQRVVAQAEIRRLIEKIDGMAPDDLSPLTQREIIELVGRCIPAASRDVVRQCYRRLRPNPKPGPRGPRNPDREARIQELGEKLIAAQLHN